MNNFYDFWELMKTPELTLKTGSPESPSPRPYRPGTQAAVCGKYIIYPSASSVFPTSLWMPSDASLDIVCLESNVQS